MASSQVKKRKTFVLRLKHFSIATLFLAASVISSLVLAGADEVSAAPGDYVWTTAAGGLSSPASYGAVASSADGLKLAAVVISGDVYTSTNGGTTWVQRTIAGSPSFTDIASSADGTKLFGVVPNRNGVYVSTDSGATWTQESSVGVSFNSIEASADGSKLLAVSGSNPSLKLYTSTNSGTTWVERTDAGTQAWRSIASSADGTKLVATVESSSTYTSTDSGATWTARTIPGGVTLINVASSANGLKLAGTASGPFAGTDVYTSSDAGANWIKSASVTSLNMQPMGIASSSDGSRLALLMSSSSIYTSINTGNTWTEQTDTPSTFDPFYVDIAMSASGAKIIASQYGGDLHLGVSEEPQSPTNQVDGNDPSTPQDIDSTPTFSGANAEGDGTITITLTPVAGGSDIVYTTTADAGGSWSYTLTSPLAAGDYLLNIDTGQTGTFGPFSLTVSASSPTDGGGGSGNPTTPGAPNTGVKTLELSPPQIFIVFAFTSLIFLLAAYLTYNQMRKKSH